MGISERFSIAFAKSQLAAGTVLPTTGTIFISVAEPAKEHMVDLARRLAAMGFQAAGDRQAPPVACRKPAFAVQRVKKMQEGHPNLLDYLIDGDDSADHEHAQRQGRPHRRRPHPRRRRAHGVPCITTIQAADAAVRAMEALRDEEMTVQALQDRFTDTHERPQNRRWLGGQISTRIERSGLTRVQAFGQLAEGFGLDLADALAGQAERLADLLERLRLVVVQAEPHPQHGRLALVHRFEHAACTCFRSSLSTISSSGLFEPLVHHHLAQRPAGFGLIGLRRGVVDADRLLDDRQLLLRQAQHAGDLFGRRRAAQLFGQPGAWPAATCESSSTM